MADELEIGGVGITILGEGTEVGGVGITILGEGTKIGGMGITALGLPIYGWYTKGNYAVLPTTDAYLETHYTGQELMDIVDDDSVYVSQIADGYAIHQARVYASDDANVNIKWNGKSDIACSLSTVYLQVYNYDTDNWDTLDSDSDTEANTDFNLIVTGLDLTNYKDTGNLVCCRVYQKAQ